MPEAKKRDLLDDIDALIGAAGSSDQAAKRNIKDVMDSIDSVVRADPATTRLMRYATIGRAIATFFGASGSSSTTARSRVTTVLDGGELEQKFPGETGLITVYGYRPPLDPNDREGKRPKANLTDLLAAKDHAMYVHKDLDREILTRTLRALSNLAFLCHGWVMGIGPADDMVFTLDRRETMRSPALKFLYVGITGVAAARVVPEVAKSGITNEAVAKQLCDYWETNASSWRPRPGELPAAAATQLVVKLLEARGIPDTNFGQPEFDAEIAHWVRAGSGAKALREALGRVCVARGIDLRERAEWVTSLMELVMSTFKDPSEWLTAEADATKASAELGKTAGDAVLQAVAFLPLVRQRPGISGDSLGL